MSMALGRSFFKIKTGYRLKIFAGKIFFVVLILRNVNRIKSYKNITISSHSSDMIIIY